MYIFPESINRILVTGGGGFIGGALVRRLLKETKFKIFNIDKLNYVSNLSGINQEIKDLNIPSERYQFLKVDISDYDLTKKSIKIIDPDLVFHLAAESHVDKSIEMPELFIKSNIVGTFNLLTSLIPHWERLPTSRKKNFRFVHISTDEVFGSLGPKGFFSEKSPYDPRSPYSASKASSDHLVRSWHHTYGLPTLITNSSNNFGPWQFPEKLIPVTIKNAISNKPISVYGDGGNIRDWIYVEDHIDALLTVATKGSVGNSYCIGGGKQKTNLEVIDIICDYLDSYNQQNAPHERFKVFTKDRLGHDRRYAIDNKKILEKLSWSPKYDFKDSLFKTIKWYLQNRDFLNIINN